MTSSGTTRRRTAAALTVAGTTLAMTALLTPGVATAGGVRCTDTVTTLVVLTADLDCPGSGPRVLGPDGVLDLAGHSITGSGTGTGVTLGGGQVSGGTITRFGTGIDGSSGSITDMSVTRSAGAGIGSQQAGPLTIERTSVTRSAGTGILVHGGVVRDSVSSRNGGSGILSAGQLTVLRSTLRGNGSWGITGADFALRLEDSNVSGNGSGGIRGSILRASTILRNRIADHPSGPGFDATFWTLEGTAISGNVFSGNQTGLLARIVGPIAHALPISGNRFLGNLAAGIWLEDPATVTQGDPVLTVSGNTFVGNGFSSGGLVDRAGRSVDDGLHLDVAGLRVEVRDNVSVGNADYGIEAYDDVVDGGGNKARHNGQPAQCLGVVCS